MALIFYVGIKSGGMFGVVFWCLFVVPFAVEMSAHCLISEQKLDFIREVVNQRDPKEDYKLIRSIGVGTYGEVYKVGHHHIFFIYRLFV